MQPSLRCGDPTSRSYRGSNTAVRDWSTLRPSSLASQLLQICGVCWVCGVTQICRSRLAGDAVVAVMPPSLRCGDPTSRSYRGSATAVRDWSTLRPSSLASQLLQICGVCWVCGVTHICRSRLAGDAVVAVMPPSLRCGDPTSRSYRGSNTAVRDWSTLRPSSLASQLLQWIGYGRGRWVGCQAAFCGDPRSQSISKDVSPARTCSTPCRSGWPCPGDAGFPRSLSWCSCHWRPPATRSRTWAGW